MKRTSLPLVFLLTAATCALAVAILRREAPLRPPTSSGPPASEPTTSRPASTPAAPPAEPATLPAPTLPHIAAVAPPQGAAPPAAETKTVPFEVVTEDGVSLAVAFGDTILGRVEPSTPVRGRIEPPPPQLWPTREIPYAVHPELKNPERVEAAIRYLNANSPVRFVPLAQNPAPESIKDAIVFETGREHCLSALGKTGGLQPIRLSPGCGTQEILHEILHALGFVHEQSRPDRDRYVEVAWNEIEEKYRDQFEIVPEAWMEAERGSPFDFRSIMIYGPDAFAARPGQATLRPRDPAQAIRPPAQGLSEGDLQRLRRLYRM